MCSAPAVAARPSRGMRLSPVARRIPLLAGASLSAGLDAPFLIAGTLKSIYDLGLFALFRRVPIAVSRGTK